MRIKKILAGIVVISFMCMIAYASVGIKSNGAQVDTATDINFSSDFTVSSDGSTTTVIPIASKGAAAITSGTIDGVAINSSTIGVTTPAAGKFTTLEATGATTLGDIVATAGNVKVSDDYLLSIGTTTTNEATKITAEFDKTTTGIGLITQGTASNPQVLNVNPGSTVKARSTALIHSAGAGDCDDLIVDYKRAWVTGSGDAGMTVVGDAPRIYVGVTGGANNSVASAAYACQPWVKHEGTGAITAMSGLSALVDVNADNFTASTVNAGHFHIEGGATVTGQYDGVMIEAYPDVRSLDSLLALATDSGAVVASAIRITGAPVSEMTLSSGAKVYTGTAATRAAVRAQVGDTPPLGSMYIGVGAVTTTKPYTYIKVTEGPGDTDWERVVTQASD